MFLLFLSLASTNLDIYIHSIQQLFFLSLSFNLDTKKQQRWEGGWGHIVRNEYWNEDVMSFHCRIANYKSQGLRDYRGRKTLLRYVFIRSLSLSHFVPFSALQSRKSVYLICVIILFKFIWLLLSQENVSLELLKMDFFLVVIYYKKIYWCILLSY